MNQYPSRKMGFVEKFCALMNDKAAGSCTIAAIVKVRGIIDFELFKQAWSVLFQRQPMLRVTQAIRDNTYYFDFNARLSDISINHIVTESEAEAQRIADEETIKPFDLAKQFWRAILVTMPKANCSYLMLGISHSISDGASMSWLMGDLLRIIIELQADRMPHQDSLEIPPSLNEAIDLSLFTPTPLQLLPDAYPFQNPTTMESSRTRNLFCEFDANFLNQLLMACRQYGTTVNGALLAALALSVYEADQSTLDHFDFWTAINLRTALKQKIDGKILSFYAHQVFGRIKMTDQDFWGLAVQAKSESQRAFKEYIVESEDNDELMNNVFTSWQDSIKQQQFFLSHALTNIGVIDEAFHSIETQYPIEKVFFNVSQQAMPQRFIIAAVTFKGKLTLAFNFSAPAMNQNYIEKVIAGMRRHLEAALVN